MEKKRFKELFPHLAREVEAGISRVSLDDEQDDKAPSAKGAPRKWAGYNPDVVGFIRRCKTVEQASEVIKYMEERGEITPERAAELKKQLEESGLSSFGNRKEDGFYHRNER
ncbi:MAG: DUF2095 family protein [Candidatus Bathyarchaeota archaeon]|nr:MAG: DUF2095 family protein [Candidatus Bathyarchaeota archaeon]